MDKELKDRIVDAFNRSKQRDEWFKNHAVEAGRDRDYQLKDVVPIVTTTWETPDHLLDSLERYEHLFEQVTKAVEVEDKLIGLNRQVHCTAWHKTILYVPRDLFEDWMVTPRYLGLDRGRSRITTKWFIDTHFPSGEAMPTMHGFSTEGGVKPLELMAVNRGYTGAFKMKITKKGGSWLCDFDRP